MQPESIQLELPATHKYLNVATACIAEMLARVDGIQDHEQAVYNLQLAVQEACANIVDHAYPHGEGRFGLTFTLMDEPLRLVVELRDVGRTFDPTLVPAPTMNSEVLQVRGYGVFLMRQIMDEVQYESHSGENCLRMTKQL